MKSIWDITVLEASRMAMEKRYSDPNIRPSLLFKLCNRINLRPVTNKENPALRAFKQFNTNIVHATRLGPDGENFYEPYKW